MDALNKLRYLVHLAASNVHKLDVQDSVPDCFKMDVYCTSETRIKGSNFVSTFLESDEMPVRPHY